MKDYVQLALLLLISPVLLALVATPIYLIIETTLIFRERRDREPGN